MTGGRFSSFKALLSLEENSVVRIYSNKLQKKLLRESFIHIFYYFHIETWVPDQKTGTYWALAPDEASLLFSEEVLKSTPPRPILGAAAAAVDAVDVASREPNVNPPVPPRVDCPNPATVGTLTVNTQAICNNGLVPQTRSGSTFLSHLLTQCWKRGCRPMREPPATPWWLLCHLDQGWNLWRRAVEGLWRSGQSPTSNRCRQWWRWRRAWQ